VQIQVEAANVLERRRPLVVSHLEQHCSCAVLASMRGGLSTSRFELVKALTLAFSILLPQEQVEAYRDA
jgi:hypothetical protein